MSECKFCRKLGLIGCICVFVPWAVAAPIKDAKLPPSYSVAPITTAVSATTSGTATMSFIPDQVTGTMRIAVWHGKQSEQARAAVVR